MSVKLYATGSASIISVKTNKLNEEYFAKISLYFNNYSEAYEFQTAIKKEDYDMLKNQIDSSDKVRAIEVIGELELKLSQPISN